MSQKSKASKVASKAAPSEISYKSSQLKSELTDKIDKMSMKSYGSSSIRTTTTTKERLADIERQLEVEVQKRRAAENAIK